MQLGRAQRVLDGLGGVVLVEGGRPPQQLKRAGHASKVVGYLDTHFPQHAPQLVGHGSSGVAGEELTDRAVEIE